MSFRVVLIESECTIHLKLNNLLIDKGEGDIWIPLDDISIIVLDNLKINVTMRLMSTLSEHNIGVVICNMDHLPIGFYSSYDNYSRISKSIGYQIEKDQKFYQDILLNSGLDYGYTIIRAYFARLCVGYGLNSQLGIHHKNEYNRFNLIDDLMEPIRPFVDLYAYRMLKNEKYFKIEHRRKLVNILNHKVKYMDKKMFLANMIEEYVAQYAAYLAGKRDRVVFPQLCDYIGDGDDY